MKKENWYKLLYAISALLVVGFCIRVGADYFLYDPSGNSAPFYVFVLERCLVFLLPGIIAFVLAKVAKRKFNS